MEYLERSITVFDPSYVKPIYVVQGSNMFEIRITITDWNIPADAEVYWQVATKTKGELNSASLAGNTIYINPYKTTFSEAGKGYLQVRIESGGKLLVSFSIDVFIQEDRVSSPVEGSNSDVIRVLVNQYVEEATEDLIGQVQSIVDNIIASIPSDYTELESRVDELEDSQGGGLSAEAKQALLACFAKVAWIDEDGQDYYDALESALYAITEISVSPTSLSFGALNSTQQLTGRTKPTGGTITWTSSNTSVATVDSTGLVTSVGYGTATITASCQGYTATCAVTIAQATVTSISAVYTQSGTVYDTDSLDSLKSDLVVTANWSNGTTSTVASEDYTLSGTLTVGTSTITVSYSGKNTTFNVTVTEYVPSFNVSYTQGSIGAGNTDSNRVTGVIYTPIHLKQGDTFTINIPQGYSVYPNGINANNNESLAGTRAVSNVLNAYCVSDTEYIPSNNTQISGDLFANDGSSMKGNGTRGWITNSVVYTYVPDQSPGYSFKGLGFLVKKDDNSDITPSEIEAIITFDYVEA